MATSRFAEQTELNPLHALYVTTYSQLNPEMQHWNRYDDCQVYKAFDGAGVWFTPETALFGDQYQRATEAAVGKNLAMQIIDCMAYFIAQGTPVDQVPDELRFSLALCHGNVHWTGLIGKVTSFKDIYNIFYSYCSLEHPQTVIQEAVGETSKRNAAKNLIYDKLGIKYDQPDPSNNTPEDQRAAKLFDLFKNNKIKLSHYDSMNSSYYANQVKDSLTLFLDQGVLDVENMSVPCSQQRGNTCGDHTVANLFSASMYSTLPKINQPSSDITSEYLREITNALPTRTEEELLDDLANPEVFSSEANNKPELQDKTILLLSTLDINNRNESKQEILEGVETKKPLLSKFEADIIKIVNNIADIDSHLATEIVNAAIAEKDITQIIEKFLGKKEIASQLKDNANKINSIINANITEDLSDIFSGIVPENYTPYCHMARFIAQDRCAEIEHDRLRIEMQQKELIEQEDTFKKFESNPDYTKTTTSTPTPQPEFQADNKTEKFTDDDAREFLNNAKVTGTSTFVQPTQKSNKGKILGGVIGGTLGAGVGVGLILLGVFFYQRRLAARQPLSPVVLPCSSAQALGVPLALSPDVSAILLK